MDNAPWNTKTWIDTFTRNSALDTHLMQMIVTMNDIRMEKKAAEIASEQEKQEIYDRAAADYYAKNGTRGEF